MLEGWDSTMEKYLKTGRLGSMRNGKPQDARVHVNNASQQF